MSLKKCLFTNGPRFICTSTLPRGLWSSSLARSLTSPPSSSGTTTSGGSWNNLQQSRNLNTANSTLGGTWSLSHVNDQNAGRIQPLFDIDFVIRNMERILESVEARGMSLKGDLTKVAELYQETEVAKKRRDEAEVKREENTAKIHEVQKSAKGKTEIEEELKEYREIGKELREEFRELNSKFNQLNDELVDLLLSIPNTLLPQTPLTQIQMLKNVDPPANAKKWDLPQDMRWEMIPGISPCPEFPVGEAAVQELKLASKVHTYLISKGFTETGNVDFVKRVLIEGTGMNTNQFLRVREPNVKVGLSHATYLVGGASFPAFLALFAQSIIQSTTDFPIKYFVNGRSYMNKPGKLPGTFQCTASQVFVAAHNEDQLAEEYHKLQGNMEEFYKVELGIPFSSFLYPAKRLQLYEKQKVGFYSAEHEKILGNLSFVSDFVSKRLLCCYKDDGGAVKFLHLLTGQFFNITEFLRPPFETESSSSSHISSTATAPPN